MAKSPRTLSKSRLKRGLQCSKSLHLTLFNKELEPETDTATQFIFDEGNEVGEEARKQFKEGVLIDCEPWDHEGSVKATVSAMENGATVIFEASFSANGLFARVDILKRKSKSSKWEVIEVKKSGKLKDEHIEDVAIQALVLEFAKIPVKSYSVMHLNSTCIFPNLKNLFVTKDVTQEVSENMSDLKKKIKQLQQIVKSEAEPKVAIGPHCDSPYECPFKSHCWKDFPSPSVFDLPGVGAVSGWKMIKAGVTRIDDLDETKFKGKTKTAIEVTKSGKRWVEKDGIEKAIKSWSWPLYFLDFETLAPAVPRYEGCSPYSEVPFQFSCHVWESPTDQIKHFEYLHISSSDPRPDLAKALVSGFGSKGSILAYCASVERKILNGLAKAVPNHTKELKAIASRLVDPLPVFQNHVYDKDFNGSFSIKSVAPALIGQSYSYDNLEISNGMEARAIVEQIMRSLITGQDLEKMKQALLVYCRQDTIAMVELVRWMIGTQKAA